MSFTWKTSIEERATPGEGIQKKKKKKNRRRKEKKLRAVGVASKGMEEPLDRAWSLQRNYDNIFSFLFNFFLIAIHSMQG